jgi:hypothetical protein
MKEKITVLNIQYSEILKTAIFYQHFWAFRSVIVSLNFGVSTFLMSTYEFKLYANFTAYVSTYHKTKKLLMQEILRITLTGVT